MHFQIHLKEQRINSLLLGSKINKICNESNGHLLFVIVVGKGNFVAADESKIGPLNFTLIIFPFHIPKRKIKIRTYIPLQDECQGSLSQPKQNWPHEQGLPRIADMVVAELFQEKMLQNYNEIEKVN